MNDKGLAKSRFSSFSALRHRNFRLFWLGQCISLIGSWMQNIGQAWLVLELTNSALKLSYVSMMQFLPMMIFSLYAGTLVDRFPKRKILLLTQSSLGIIAFILATLTYLGIVQYWHVLLLAVLLGIINTIDMPTRQSFVIELVGREDLMNAIALNSGIFNLARIVGPAVAGVLIGAVGIATCFYINALTYLAVIAGIWMIKFPEKEVSLQGLGLKQTIADIREGLHYIAGYNTIKQPLLLLAVISTFVMNFNVLIPIFAAQDLNQNAAGYGFLMTCMGLGSLIGALAIAARSKYGPELKFLIGGALGMSLFLALLGLAKNYWLACATLLVVGLCSITFTALVNSIIQLNSADHMRGRVMSVYSLVFVGVIPIGSLYTGYITENAGAPICMIISGLIGVVATFYTIIMLGKKRSRKSMPGE